MHCDYKTREEARVSLFDYLEVFYNRQRATQPSSTRLRWSSKHQQPPNRHVSAVRGQDQLRALVTAMARLDLPFARASSARSHPVPAHRVSDLQDLKNDRPSV